MKRFTPTRGAFTIEVLIAFFVVTIALGAATMVALGGQVSGMDMNLTSGGLYRGGGVYEKNVANAISGWSSLSSVPASNPLNDNGYSTSTAVSFVSPCMKEVTSIVGWTSDMSRILGASITTLAGSVAAARKLGNDCDPTPPGNWEAPSSYPISDPIFSGSLASDVDVITRQGSRFALLTTWKNPNPGGDATFWVINVTDLDLDPLPFSSYATPKDLLAVDATSNFAFAVGATTTAQRPLQIFDISDVANISHAAEASLPNAKMGDGRSVYYYDGKVYVGTQYLPCPSCAAEVNHEFHIFDVSDPFNPTWGASIDVQRNVNSILVADGIAYLATGPGGDNTVLKMYDVDPLSPSYLTLLGQYAASSPQEGTSLYLLGDYLFLGRERTTGSNHDFLVINVANPSAPILADSVKLELNNNTAVEGIVVKGRIAFIVTSDTTPANGGGPFIMMDVGDPTNISLFEPCTPVNWSEKPTGLDMADDYAFISNESNDALQVVYPTPSCM